MTQPFQPEARKEACELDVAGKYEPQLRENGIPADVLEKLLPGDDVVELAKPTIAGGLGYRFVKRAFDVCSTGCALIILAIPMGIIALRIKSESPGPVIYAQERVGKNGKPFMVYKFRSMYVDAEKRGAQWAQGDDPRVTPFGKVMRKTRLDEIPQFWNVFKGDMTLIGPRPERPAFCAEFEKRIHGWHYRTMVTPGLSGLAQVTGGYDLLPKEKVVLDLEYIKHRSIAVDLKIILKTLGVVSTGRGQVMRLLFLTDSFRPSRSRVRIALVYWLMPCEMLASTYRCSPPATACSVRPRATRSPIM